MDRYRTQLIIKQPTKMTPNECKVLKALQNAPSDKDTNNQMGALNYSQLTTKTKLTKEVLSKVVKQLMKDGKVEYLRGIVDRKGKSAGSGFRLPTYPTAKKRKIVSLIADYEMQKMDKTKGDVFSVPSLSKIKNTKQPSKKAEPVKSPTKSSDNTTVNTTDIHIEVKKGMTADEYFSAKMDVITFVLSFVVIGFTLTKGLATLKDWIFFAIAVISVVIITIKRNSK